jgi:hypothetical protein
MSDLSTHSASRWTTLVESAIEALEDGRDPLEHAFLVEHGVTIHEIFELADAMAFGLRMTKVVTDEVKAGSMLGRNASLLLAKAVKR